MIFLSYSSADSQVVDALEAQLRERVAVWRDKTSLHAGDKWPKRLGDAIAQADMLVLVWSQECERSEFVELEWNIALALKKPIVPLVLDDTAIPPALSAFHRVPGTNLAGAAATVIRDLSTLLPKLPNPDGNEQVLGSLASLSETEPSQVLKAAKNVFIQVSVPQKSPVERWHMWMGLAATVLLVALLGKSQLFPPPSQVIVYLPNDEDRATVLQYFKEARDNRLPEYVQQEVEEQARESSDPFPAVARRTAPTRIETAREIQKQVRMQGLPQVDSSSLMGEPDRGWVVLVPDWAASELEDTGVAQPEKIWINKFMLAMGGLDRLKLAPFDGKADMESRPDQRIVASGLLKGRYDELMVALASSGFNFRSFPFDWRKNFDVAANELALFLKRMSSSPRPSVSIVAHGAGALVARRALQMFRPTDGLAIISNLVLLAPISYGTFDAVQLLDGSSSMLRQLDLLDLMHSKSDLQGVFASMSSLYQLLPWDRKLIKRNPLDSVAYWQEHVDEKRLRHLFGWGGAIDTKFLNERTTVIVGYGEPTVVEQRPSDSIAEIAITTQQGDGVVAVSNAVLPGVATFYVPLTHSQIPTSLVVVSAIKRILAGKPVELPREPHAVSLGSEEGSGDDRSK